MPAFSRAIAAMGVAAGKDVIERHRCNRGQPRCRQHVGRVESTTQSRFKKKNVGRRPSERKKGSYGCDLKQRDALAVVRPLSTQEIHHQQFLADGCRAVLPESKSARENHEVRRCIHVHPFALGLGNGAEETRSLSPFRSYPPHGPPAANDARDAPCERATARRDRAKGQLLSDASASGAQVSSGCACLPSGFQRRRYGRYHAACAPSRRARTLHLTSWI